MGRLYVQVAGVEDEGVVRRLQGRCGKTRDFREGVMAFLEKRPAEYEGR